MNSILKKNKIRIILLALVFLSTNLFIGGINAKPGGKITFTSYRDGNGEIYEMNADGTSQTNVSFHKDWDWQGDYSKDGSKIVFSSDRDWDGSGSIPNQEIYTMNADGTNLKRLIDNQSTADAQDYIPAFSPNGAKVAFTSYRNSNYDIFLMNSDGSDEIKLTSNANTDEYPAFSPDNTKIAFHTNRNTNWEIYVMNVDGTSQTNLTNNSGDDIEPNYSPDGSKIVFTSDRDGDKEIWIMNSNGSSPTKLTANTSISDEAPVFSPDGSKIAFVSDQDGDNEIYTMNIDGTSRTQLTFNTVDDLYPSWSVPTPDPYGVINQSTMPGSERVYLPNITKSYAGWTTPFIVQNVDSHPAVIKIEFITPTGGLEHSLEDVLEPGASEGYNPTKISAIPNGWKGAVVVSAQFGRRIVAVVNEHHSSGQAMSYSGF